MAEGRIDNHTPLYPSPIFIPSYWEDTTIRNTSTSTSSFTTNTIIGQIVMVARTTLPSSNYLWCDGGTYNAFDYPVLFSLINYTYGGSGSSFQVPNLINKTLVGADITSILQTTYGGSPVVSGGNKQITENQLANHSHAITISPTLMATNVGFNQTSTGVAPYIFNPLAPINVNGNSLDVNVSMGNQGGNQDYLLPFFVCNYVIRAI